MTVETRTPLCPTIEPTASICGSFEKTATLERDPGSRAIALISTTLLAISGASRANSFSRNFGCERDRRYNIPLAFAVFVKDRDFFRLSDFLDDDLLCGLGGDSSVGPF